MPQPYTPAELQDLIAQIKASDDDPATVGRPLLDPIRVYRTLFEFARDERQQRLALEARVAALEALIP